MPTSLHDDAVPTSAERTLWRNHAATPTQRRSSGKRTQADLLLQHLRAARANGTGLALPEIMRLGIAQHGARLHELRKRGYRITNAMAHVGGVVQSVYTLNYDPEAGR